MKLDCVALFVTGKELRAVARRAGLRSAKFSSWVPVSLPDGPPVCIAPKFLRELRKVAWDLGYVSVDALGARVRSYLKEGKGVAWVECIDCILVHPATFGAICMKMARRLR